MTAFLNAFDELTQALTAQGDQLLMLPLDLIEEDPANPRDDFDDGELRALAATIAARGVLQPIVVRPANAEGHYRIRFGARRFRGARLAGQASIPALVRQGAASEVDSLIEQVIENDQRASLTTAELAHTVASLQHLGLSQSEISARLGRSKDRIAMLAAVQTMPPVLQALATTLGLRTLYELHQAWRADPSVAETWIEAHAAGDITQAQARALAATARATTPADRRPEGQTASMRRKGKMCINVQVGDRSGRLELRAGPEPHVAFVQFDDAPSLATVDMASIRLVRIAPATAADCPPTTSS